MSDKNAFELAIENHTRALAAHCECLATNVANMICVMQNAPAAYPDSHYYQVLQKWGLIDEKGEPTL